MLGLLYCTFLLPSVLASNLGYFGSSKFTVCLHIPLRLQKTWLTFLGFQPLISAPLFILLVLCHLPISKCHEVKHTINYWTHLNVLSFIQELQVLR